MNSSHAIAIDADTLAVLRDYASQARLDALCAGAGPLADDDRQALETALQWWQEQHANAETRVREIVARLARQ